MINIHELSIGNVILIGCDRAVVTSLTEKFVNGIYVDNQMYPIPLDKEVKSIKPNPNFWEQEILKRGKVL